MLLLDGLLVELLNYLLITTNYLWCPDAVFQNASGLRELTEHTFAHSVSLQSAEAGKLRLRRSLHAHMPYLATLNDTLAAPEYMWSHIVDFFACSEAHGWCGSDQARTPPDTLAGLGSETMLHILWRFTSLFRVPGALALSLKGLLTDIIANAAAHVDVHTLSPAWRSDDEALGKQRFSLYSGHDVTLFPLQLFLHRCSNLPAPRVWPGYAAFITIELLSPGASLASAVIRWRFWDPFPFPSKPTETADRELDPETHEVPLAHFLHCADALMSELSALSPAGHS